MVCVGLEVGSASGTAGPGHLPDAQLLVPDGGTPPGVAAVERRPPLPVVCRSLLLPLGAHVIPFESPHPGLS